MVAGNDLNIVFNDLATLLKKAYQVHRIYDKIWTERADIYANIIIQLKKGRGGLFGKKMLDISKDFATDIRRIAVLNARERDVLNAIIEYKDETGAMLERVIKSMTAFEIGSKSLFELLSPQTVKSLSAAVERYLKTTSLLQDEFLTRELQFISKPTIDSLRVVYCTMRKVQKETMAFQQMYDKESSAYTNLINIQHSLNTLTKSVESDIKRVEAEVEPATRSKISVMLRKVRDALFPYFNKNDRQLYGTFPQRVALNTTDFPKIVVSIGIRMALIAPLLFSATEWLLGYRPSLKFTPVKNYPQFYLDFYLFVISYIAYVLDVIPGLAKYSIEGPQKLFAAIKSATGMEDPLKFTCNDD